MTLIVTSWRRTQLAGVHVQGIRHADLRQTIAVGHIRTVDFGEPP
jgi:hypothetical protein